MKVSKTIQFLKFWSKTKVDAMKNVEKVFIKYLQIN